MTKYVISGELLVEIGNHIWKQKTCLWEHKEDVNRITIIMEGLQNIMQKVC